MMESLLLYMNLRSKQMVRVLAGIGPFRCLFLIGIVCHPVLCFCESNERMGIAGVLSAYALAVS